MFIIATVEYLNFMQNAHRKEPFNATLDLLILCNFWILRLAYFVEKLLISFCAFIHKFILVKAETCEN